MSGLPPGSIRVGLGHYQYEAEATAGVTLDTGTRWWGTSVRWRPGRRGAWERTTIIGVHPFDTQMLELALASVIWQAVRGKR